jgi:MFS superfamily sulfate permease-like transporter
MNKTSIKAILAISALICIIAGFSAIDGLIPEWMAAALIVVSFPIFVLSLGMYWKASDKEGDYPFIGY